MTRRILILTILCWLSVVMQAEPTETEQLLQTLDAAVANKDSYVKVRQAEIQRLKNNLRYATEPTDRYLSCLQIAHAYSKFDGDSSFVYLRKCVELGFHYQNKAWIQRAVICKAFTYADRGELSQAEAELALIGDVDAVMPSLKGEYAWALLMRYTTYALNSDTTGKGPEMMKKWKTYSPYLSKTDPYYYSSYLTLCRKIKDPAVERQLWARLRQVKSDSFEAAMYHITLYQIYSARGEKEKALAEAIRSALADIHQANRSSLALLTVVKILAEDPSSQNLTRLRNYMALCEENVADFKDAGRSVQLLRVVNHVNSLINAKEEHQKWALEGVLFLVSVFALVCVVRVFRFRKKAREIVGRHDCECLQRQKAEEEVKEEKNSLDNLRKENAMLRVRAGQVDDMMVKSMRLIADILTASREYKKKMHNYLYSGMVKEAKRLSGSSSTKEEVAQQFYHHFDDAFLMLHPDFVARFNALLQDDKQITPEDSHSLTPELRIYALISLGIEDSVNIADILMYSPQTIYNYRLKIRHSTKEPGFKIAEYVKGMYR